MKIKESLINQLDWNKINQLWKVLELDKSTGIYDVSVLRMEVERRFELFVNSGKSVGQFMYWWFYKVSKPKLFSKEVGEQYEIHFTPIRGVDFSENKLTEEELFEQGITFDLPKKDGYDLEESLLLKIQQNMANKEDYETANAIKQTIKKYYEK